MNPIWWHKWDASIRTQEKKGTARARNFSVLKVLGGTAELGKRESQKKECLLPLKFSNLFLLALFPLHYPRCVSGIL